MADTNKIFCRLSFTFGICCLISLIISFASDRWVVSTEQRLIGFKNLGLWSACFTAFRPPAWTMVHKMYEGCWWVFDREMDEMRSYLIPSWFQATQGLVTLSLVFELLCLILMIINAINCFPYSKFKNGITLGISVTVTLLHGLSGIFLTVAVILFGAKADNERSTWLQNPDQNYLSWSFGLCVLAAFLAILVFLTTMLESYRYWLKRKNKYEPDEPIEMPAATITQNYPSSQIYHPSFASRSSNQSLARSQDNYSRRSDSEFYKNSYYENDESRQRGRMNGHAPQNSRRWQQDRRKFDDDVSYRDNIDSGNPQTGRTAQSVQSFKSSITALEANDYEESKRIKQPVLPEYISKTKPNASKKDLYKDKERSYDESIDSNDLSEDEENNSHSRKTNSNRKGKKTARHLSNSKKDRDRVELTERRRSKGKNDSSDDERSRSRSRSKLNSSPGSRRKSSRSRERSSSRHRSHSRDLDSVYTDSCTDSDAASNVSRSRRKQKNHDEYSSKKSRSRNQSSEEFIKKDKHGGRSASSTSSTKKQRRRYSDDLSGSESNSRKQSKRKGDDGRSLEGKRAKSLDFSDTESVRSKRSRQGGSKPKGSYSGYYES